MGYIAPYVAVINLALMTAHHWRTIRLKLMKSGMTEPMGLPTAHMLLDLTEQLILESMQSDKPELDKARREKFVADLYREAPKSFKDLPDGWQPPPPGFDDDDDAASEASADIAMRMVMGR